ncbi:MAG: hypothetical protein ACN6O0_20450 [Achromobacter spanius]
MKLIKAIRGVKAGEIYPSEFGAGDECPEELLAAARELGALEEDSTDDNEKLDLFTKLEAEGIKHDKRWGLEKLRAALAEGKKD